MYILSKHCLHSCIQILYGEEEYVMTKEVTKQELVLLILCEQCDNMSVIMSHITDKSHILHKWALNN